MYDEIVICMLFFFFSFAFFSFSLPPIGDVYAVAARGPYNAGYDREKTLPLQRNKSSAEVRKRTLQTGQHAYFAELEKEYRDQEIQPSSLFQTANCFLGHCNLTGVWRMPSPLCCTVHR